MPDAPNLAAQFQPDYTPEQMENLGVYDALYRGQGPRLASLGEWKPEWISEHDPKGWAQWYKRYASGRRIPDEDERQIKRWLSLKARHGGPFSKNPTPRRGWALRNWGIDPAKLVAAEEQARVGEMLDEYQRKAMQKYVQERVKQSSDLTKLAPKWSDRAHLLAALPKHLTDTQTAISNQGDIDKEMTDLALISRAWLKSQKQKELLAARLKKFQETAAYPSLAAKTYYHGSPTPNIEKLRPDSYVTPDKRIAEIMGRFHEDTGKPWSDDDLDRPYDFGPEIRFKPGREPTGKPTIYAVTTDPANLDLLDNPYEHKTKLELAAQKVAAVYNFEGDVQGVSLRKTLHKVLDELKHPGLAYNNARTGEAIAVLPGGKKKQQEILALLRQRLADRSAENKQLTGRPGEAKYKRPLQEGVDYKITPRPEVRERMYPVTVTPEAIQKFIQLQGFNRLAAENADYQKQWLTERYRLQPDAAGNLTGKVPELAKKQLLAGEPIYEYQLAPGWQDVKAAAQIQTQIQTQIQKQASNAARRLFTRLMKDTAAGNISWHGTGLASARGIMDSSKFIANPGDVTFSRYLPLRYYAKGLGAGHPGTAIGLARRSPEFVAAGIPRPDVRSASTKRIMSLSRHGGTDRDVYFLSDAYYAPYNQGIPVPPRRGVLRYAFQTGDKALDKQFRDAGARLIPKSMQEHFVAESVPRANLRPLATPMGRNYYNGTPTVQPGQFVINRGAALRHLGEYGRGNKLTPQMAHPLDNILADSQVAAAKPVAAAQPWWQRLTQQISGHVTPLWQRLTQQIPGLLKRSADEKTAELIPDLTLQEHQQRIADRTLEEDPRMLVYHGLGSGKSLSAIAAAEAAKKQFGDNYGIAVPASLRGNFQKEIKKFTRDSDPEIMSYTGLALGKKFQEPPQTLIMDEAHRLRNPDSASSQGALAAAQAAKRLLLLTGSPITNSPSDLANLLSMLHNKQITPEAFEKRYIDYKKVSPGIINWFRGIKPGEQPVVKNEQELRELLKGKVDYQPSKTPEGVNVNEEIVRVPLSPQQQKIQKAIRTKVPPGFLWKLDQEFPLSRDELAKLNSFLTGMRQVSLSTQPFRADKDPAKAFEQSAKLQEAFKRLKTTLDSDKRKKAIIYSNFIDSGLAPYAAGLERAGVPHAFFHGGVSPKARQAAVEAYNKGKLRALLIGPAGAEGLSTKGTSLIQLMDPHWHESRSQQARGRGLRFDSHTGLPEELKNVAVQRFISSSEDPSWLGKMMGYSRERTGDEVLEHLTAEKEKLNEVFRKILREAGTEKQSKITLAAAENANTEQGKRQFAEILTKLLHKT